MASYLKAEQYYKRLQSYRILLFMGRLHEHLRTGYNRNPVDLTDFGAAVSSWL